MIHTYAHRNHHRRLIASSLIARRRRRRRRLERAVVDASASSRASPSTAHHPRDVTTSRARLPRAARLSPTDRPTASRRVARRRRRRRRRSTSTRHRERTRVGDTSANTNTLSSESSPVAVLTRKRAAQTTSRVSGRSHRVPVTMSTRLIE